MHRRVTPCPYTYRLEVFLCVAKHLHITHASDELHISQPSVSRHLRLLEEDFGLALHRMLSRGIELTPEGEEFLKGAQSVLDQYHQLKEAFTNSHPRSGSRYLKIGSSFAESIALLPNLLAAFSRSHPEVGIVTQSGISDELEKLVLNAKIDLAFINNPGNLDSLVYEPCGTGKVVAFVSAKHPLVEKQTITVSDLRKTPLIVRTHQGDKPTRTWKQLQELAGDGFSLSVALDCELQGTLVHAVKSGEGLGFSYREFLAREIEQGEIKVLKVQGFKNSYENFVTYAKDRPLNDAAENFLALLRQKNSKSRRTLPSKPISPK
jgi:DNA-binding transcriptional LysR family regulator